MDLKKLQYEIDNKKKGLDERKNLLGEKTVPRQTSDNFLKELLHTSKTGQETNASVRVKAVNKVVESKDKGETVDPSLLEHITKSAPSPKPKSNEPVRTAAMDAKLEAQKLRESNQSTPKSSNAGFSDVISQYTNTPHVGAPMGNNGMLTEQQVLERLRANGGVMPNNNSMPNVINEQVVNMTRELLNENFGKLFAEAMRNTIIETYEAEKVKKAINENKDLIKQIVRETIIDLQKRAQSGK